MALFGFGKKKVEDKKVQCACNGDPSPTEAPAKKEVEIEQTFSGCCCGGQCNKETMSQAEAAKTTGASIKVLGSGCAKCNQLEAATFQALTELDMDTTIDHITDFSQIAAYGVMTTPALIVDGKVVSYGKVLKKDEVIKILKENRG